LKRRSDLVILMDILGAVLDGPKLPTRLAQLCNLSYDNFVKFAGRLESRGLVRRSLEQGHELYSVTPDGIQTHRDYVKLIDRVRP